MTAQTILPANSASSGGFDVANSVRLTGTNDYFHKTPSSSGSQRLFSFSAWVKKTDFSTGVLFSSGEADGNPNLALYFDSSGRINMYSTQGMQYITTRVFRDPSAWYHIVFVVDTANGTENNRQQLYVNGVRETVFSTSNVIDQNTDLSINTSAYRMAVGTGVDDDDYFGGYMAEVVFVDNQALASTSFGEFDSDSGIWKPKNVNVLTLGTNGFYLNFQDSSNLGNDVNGGTDLTEVNLAATDQSTDTCINNFATWNPLGALTTPPTFSDGNLTAAIPNSGGVFRSTVAVSSGKWYCEAKVVSLNAAVIGIQPIDSVYNVSIFSDSSGIGLYGTSGEIYKNGSNIGGVASVSNNDIVGMAIDLDNNNIYFSVNGQYGSALSGAWNQAFGSAYAVAINSGHTYAISSANGGSGTSSNISINFGSPPYAISSGNADGDGHGNFEYAVPSGYFAICTKNLAEYGG